MADRRWLDLARAIAAKAAFQRGDDGVAVDGGQNPVEFDDLHGCPVLLSLSVCQIVPQDHGNDPAGAQGLHFPFGFRSEEHTSELQSLMRISYAVFCLQKKTTPTQNTI